jgi:hypothetical protein
MSEITSLFFPGIKPFTTKQRKTTFKKLITQLDRFATQIEADHDRSLSRSHRHLLGQQTSALVANSVPEAHRILKEIFSGNHGQEIPFKTALNLIEQSLQVKTLSTENVREHLQEWSNSKPTVTRSTPQEYIDQMQSLILTKRELSRDLENQWSRLRNSNTPVTGADIQKLNALHPVFTPDSLFSFHMKMAEYKANFVENPLDGFETEQAKTIRNLILIDPQYARAYQEYISALNLAHSDKSEAFIRNAKRTIDDMFAIYSARRSSRSSNIMDVDRPPITNVRETILDFRMPLRFQSRYDALRYRIDELPDLPTNLSGYVGEVAAGRNVSQNVLQASAEVFDRVAAPITNLIGSEGAEAAGEVVQEQLANQSLMMKFFKSKEFKAFFVGATVLITKEILQDELYRISPKTKKFIQRFTKSKGYKAAVGALAAAMATQCPICGAVTLLLAV